MWNLNDDVLNNCTHHSTSSPAPLDYVDDGSHEPEDEEQPHPIQNPNVVVQPRKRISKIFGFSVTSHSHQRLNDELEESDFEATVTETTTRQFLPVDENWKSEKGFDFPRAHWVGVEFCKSPGKSGVLSEDLLQPLIKKSRRGPRSRSSQFRGVTFYRRTGRWESHIWYLLN